MQNQTSESSSQKNNSSTSSGYKALNSKMTKSLRNPISSENNNFSDKISQSYVSNPNETIRFVYESQPILNKQRSFRTAGDRLPCELESSANDLLLMENDKKSQQFMKSDIFNDGTGNEKSNFTFQNLIVEPIPESAFNTRHFDSNNDEENLRQVKIWSEGEEEVGSLMFGMPIEVPLQNIQKRRISKKQVEEKPQPDFTQKVNEIIGKMKNREEKNEMKSKTELDKKDQDVYFRLESILASERGPFNKNINFDQNIINQENSSTFDQYENQFKIKTLVDQNIHESQNDSSNPIRNFLKRNSQTGIESENPVSSQTLEIKKKKIVSNPNVFSFNPNIIQEHEQSIPIQRDSVNKMQNSSSPSRKTLEKLDQNNQNTHESNIQINTPEFVEMIKKIKTQTSKNPNQSKHSSNEDSKEIRQQIKVEPIPEDKPSFPTKILKKETTKSHKNIRFSGLIDSHYNKPDVLQSSLTPDQEQTERECLFSVYLQLPHDEQMFFFAQHLIRENEKWLEHENTIKSLKLMYHLKLEQATLFKNDILIVYRNQPEFNGTFLENLEKQYDFLKKEITEAQKIYEINAKISATKAQYIHEAQEALFLLENSEGSEQGIIAAQEIVSVIDYLDSLQPVFDIEFDIDKKIIFSCLSGQNVNTQLRPLANDKLHPKTKIADIAFEREHIVKQEIKPSFSKKSRVDRIITEINSKYDLETLRNANFYKKRNRESIAQKYEKSARNLGINDKESRQEDRYSVYEKDFQKKDKNPIENDIAKIDKLLKEIRYKRSD